MAFYKVEVWINRFFLTCVLWCRIKRPSCLKISSSHSSNLSLTLNSTWSWDFFGGLGIVKRERKKRQMQNNAWIDYLAWGLVGGNQWGCDIIRKFLWVGAPSFAVATCKIMGWGNNRTTKVAKHRGGKKCACLHMHKKMTYLSRLFQEIRVCLIIKLPSNWMMDNEYAQYIKLIVIVYQVGAEIFSSF